MVHPLAALKPLDMATTFKPNGYQMWNVVRDMHELNEYGAKLVSDHKGRFGLFGVLPLPDVDASLRETEYVLDTLKADGVVLRTSYGNKVAG